LGNYFGSTRTLKWIAKDKSNSPKRKLILTYIDDEEDQTTKSTVVIKKQKKNTSISQLC